MKSKKEIKLMGEKYAITHEDVSDRLGKYLVSACFQDGYIQCQCQEDSKDKKYTEEDVYWAINMSIGFRDGGKTYSDIDNEFQKFKNKQD